MTNIIYQYPGCSTCREALKWLIAHEIKVEALHIVNDPPTTETLRAAWQASGLPLKRLFNTAGQSYRNGGFKDRLATMSEDEQLAALAADGKLIKRPLLIAEQGVMIGFKPALWAEFFGVDPT